MVIESHVDVSRSFIKWLDQGFYRNGKQLMMFLSYFVFFFFVSFLESFLFSVEVSESITSALFLESMVMLL